MTPRSRAGRVRGALVGVCSAVLTVGAHTAAGGALPQSAALVIALLVCLASGVALGGLALPSPRGRLLSVIAGLGVAQFGSHLALVVVGGHHHGAGTALLSPLMAAAHLGAAVALGAAITAVEYLYVVSSSVLSWLRLFSNRTPRPLPRVPHRVAALVVLRPVLLLSGRGMRAPPCGLAATT